MSILRANWEDDFITLPVWTCPTCWTGILRKHNRMPMQLLETGSSVRNGDDPNWDPDWRVQRFSTLLCCDNRECGEIVAVCGSTRETELYGQHGEPIMVSAYKIRAIHPPLSPILLDNKIPNVIAARILEAGNLYWSDASAAANKLRQAVEALLTDLGIKRFVNSKGKRWPLSLHARIAIFEKKHPTEAQSLYAVKWIGNDGSHSQNVETMLEQKDVLNGFELIDAVLDEMYRKHRQRLASFAKTVNRHRGVRAKTRPKKKK